MGADFSHRIDYLNICNVFVFLFKFLQIMGPRPSSLGVNCKTRLLQFAKLDQP
jgi:hypothetical protein